jgi:hypothetical protein
MCRKNVDKPVGPLLHVANPSADRDLFFAHNRLSIEDDAPHLLTHQSSAKQVALPFGKASPV